MDYSSQFKSFFDQFDSVLEEFQIDSYSLSVTTLEDVFLKVGHLADFDGNKPVSQNNNDFDSERKHLNAPTPTKFCDSRDN